MPDESSVPSTHLNFQSVYTVGPNAAATGTWSFEMAMLPHPLAFLWAVVHDNTIIPGNEEPVNFLNTQISGTNMGDKLAALLGIARRWRLTYMSVSMYQDGADLANQGVICATQVPLVPLVLNLSSGLFHPTSQSVAGVHMEAYSSFDRPAFNSMQNMPNAYFNRSREGCYMPLRLTKTHQAWQGYEDLVAQSFAPADAVIGAANGFLPVENATEGGPPLFPYPSMRSASILWTGTAPAKYPTAAAAPLTCRLANGTTGYIAAQNLAVTTRMTVYVRCGYEIQVPPGSLYSPQLKVSPESDPVAIESYFKISRQLKDAYPVEFNDLGKIWDVISGAAKSISPFLSAIPGIGPVLSAVVPGVAGIGDTIRKALAGPQAKSSRDVAAKTSATQVQATRELQKAVSQATQPRPSPPSKKKKKKVGRRK